MPDDAPLPPFVALRRKLRALAAVAGNPGATPSERANAQALKERLQRRLRQSGAPAGDWTDHVFRLGRWARQTRNSGASKASEVDWTEQARRAGKALGRGYKKWLSD
jgi:hypothetical protein